MTSQGAAASPERVTPRGGQPSGVEVPTKLMMEPSDDDEDTGKRKKVHSSEEQLMVSPLLTNEHIILVVPVDCYLNFTSMSCLICIPIMFQK